MTDTMKGSLVYKCPFFHLFFLGRSLKTFSHGRNQVFHCIVILHSQHWVQFDDNPTAADNSKTVSHQFSNIISSVCAALMSVALDMLGQPVWSLSQVQPFSNCLAHLLTCHTLIISSLYTSLRWWRTAMGKRVLTIKIKLYCKRLHRTKFPMPLPLPVINLWLTVAPSVACYTYYRC